MNTNRRYTVLRIKEKNGADPAATVYPDGGRTGPELIEYRKGAGTMYDNNYSNNDMVSRDNGTAQEQGQVSPSQGVPASGDAAQNRTVQNQNNAAQYQNGYGGYGGSRYYGNTYDHNNGGNNGNPYGNTQSGYYKSTGGTGSYQYGNTYPNYTQMDTGKEKKKKEKKPHSHGYLKKAAVCVSLGLLFGVFAGVGIYTVQTVTKMVIGKDAVSEEKQALLGEAGDTADAAGEKAQAGTQTEGTKTESGVHVTESINTIVADVSEVVKEVMPAIVSINNHYTEKMSYFGQTMTSEADASGSGIIVGQNDTELLIVSNYHVVADADELTVQFTEGSEAGASIKGTDPDMDLAVIAVPIGDVSGSTLSEIAVATLGDSDALTVGEPAIAIGNSLGYGQSVTTGVISALNRNIQLSDGTDGTFIQTDAAINPGNSGGALLNMKGEVVGINSNKIGGSAVEGMGYAIPISAASPIIAELMLKETKNKVAEEERGYLGISGISVTQEVSEAYGMPEGVYISQVYENTAAAAAGLRKGDIIVEFDGDKISSMDTLQKELEFYAKGDTVDVTVMTPGIGGYESRTVQLTLGNKAQ